MVPIKQLFTSTLGRKYLMGASGFGLMLFIVVHLLGNLTIYAKNGDPLNTYAAKLQSLGVGLTIMEVGLVFLILLHVVTAIQVTLTSKGARPIAYEMAKSKGGPTKNNVTSRNMIITGLVLAVFLGVHIYQFRFGPGIAEGYTTTVSGVMVHDIYRVVNETFSQLKWVLFYVASMIFLGVHFRHGFWSAFQSLGLMNPRWSKPIYALGAILAVILSVGFLFIPIYIYSTQMGAAGGIQ